MVMIADGELIGGPVHEGQVRGLVVAHRPVAAHGRRRAAGRDRAGRVVGGDEAIHLPVVPLAVRRGPAMGRIGDAELRIAVGRDGIAILVGVGEVAGRYLGVQVPRLAQLEEVVIEAAVLLHHHDDMIDGDGLPDRVGRALGLGRQRSGLVSARRALGLRVTVGRGGHRAIPGGRRGRPGVFFVHAGVRICRVGPRVDG